MKVSNVPRQAKEKLSKAKVLAHYNPRLPITRLPIPCTLKQTEVIDMNTN